MKIRLEHVHYMPNELNTGTLYVSTEFKTATHLCPCGCGAKIRTPLTPTEWSLKKSLNGPSLYPSVGNWQQKCQSHYWIHDGEIIWAEKWTPEQIAMGRSSEEERRRDYYESLGTTHRGLVETIWDWIKSIFK